MKIFSLVLFLGHEEMVKLLIESGADVNRGANTFILFFYL